MKKIIILIFLVPFIFCILISESILAQTQHFHTCWEGQNPFSPMNIYVVEAKYNGQDLETGDEIGVFDDNQCVGAEVIGDTPLSFSSPLPIKTSKDDGSSCGFTEGNIIVYKIWDASSNQEYTIASEDLQYYAPGTGNPIDPVPFEGLGTAVVGINNLIVPVELSSSSFNIYINQRQIVLEWITESESNNFGFEIQRKQNDCDFSRIGFIEGYGTTSLPHKYRYYDNELPDGKYFYRLKQIDTDGAFKFSEIKSVVLNSPLNYELRQNYPNPFNQTTRIDYQIGKDNKGVIDIKLNIYNLAGELVRTLVYDKKKSGQYHVIWDGRDKSGNIVSTGIYICRLMSKNHVFYIKIIYMK